MTQYDFSRSKVLVAEQSLMLKQGLRNPLRSMGFCDLIDASDVISALGQLHKEAFDVFCLNAELDNSDTTPLVREIRRGKLHKDPFVIIFLVLSNTDDVHVRAAINSGADDILIVPFSAKQIFTKVMHLVEGRKPFIVTHDYIGPERRLVSRPGTAAVQHIEVPNPVLAHLKCTPIDKYEQAVAAAKADITKLRIRSLAKASVVEVDTICAASVADTTTSGEMALNFFKLEEFSREMVDRLQGSANTNFIEAFIVRCKGLKNDLSTATPIALAELRESVRMISRPYC